MFRGTVAGTDLGTATGGMVQIYTAGDAIYAQVAAVYVDSPATTSATTYTLGFKTNNAPTTMTSQNAGGSAGGRGSIIVMEISA